MKKEHERSLPLALPDDYLLPYGTELTPSSFTKTMDNTYIVDALDSHGNPAHYEIAVNGNLAKCTIDGEAASYENPYSHRDTGAEAPILDWFDWIASQDAAGHRYLDSDIYGGQTVAAKLFCAEHNLVTTVQPSAVSAISRLCRSFRSGSTAACSRKLPCEPRWSAS